MLAVRTLAKGLAGPAAYSTALLLRRGVHTGGVEAPFPGIPPSALAASPNELEETGKYHFSTLENGMRLASVETNRQHAVVGLFVDVGCRDEDDETAGICHILQHMAFKANDRRSSLRVVRDLERRGGNFLASGTRENLVFAVDALRSDMPLAMELIKDNVASSHFLPWELEEQKAIVSREIEELTAETIVAEALHVHGYNFRNIGRRLYAPMEALHLETGVTGDDLRAFMRKFFSPERMVLVGVGTNHDYFSDLATKHFHDMSSSMERPPREPANYTGGEFRHSNDTLDVAHLALAWEGIPWGEQDVFVAAVMHSLLGGGGSFSSGGPGKGMHSRLYRNILNLYHWCHNATAFNQMYSDTGLFGIQGSADVKQIGGLARVMLEEMGKLTGPIPDEEVMRAKNSIKASVFMNLEQTSLVYEDIGRQLVTSGRCLTAGEMGAGIEAVTGGDINRVATKMLQTPLTLAALGKLDYLPRFDQIVRMVKL